MSDNLGVMYQYAKRILIIAIGDIEEVIASTPMVQTLKENLKDKEIHLLIQNNNRSILRGFDYIDKTIVFNEKSGLMDRYKYMQTLAHENYDLVLCVTPTVTSFMMAYFTKADHRIGVFMNNLPYMKFVANIFLTESIEIDVNNSNPPHKVEIALILARHLGIKTVKKELFFKLYKEDMTDAVNTIKETGWDIKGEKVFCFHLSNNWIRQNWEVVNFYRLIDEVKKAFPKAYVLFTYDSWDLDIGREIGNYYEKEKDIACVKEKTEHQLAAIFKLCKYIITVDPKTIMLASSQKVPVIAVYPAEKFELLSNLWGPWKVKSRKLIHKPPSALSNEILSSMIELEKIY